MWRPFRSQGIGLRLVLPTAIVIALLTAALVTLQLYDASKGALENLDSYSELLGRVVLDGVRDAMVADDRPHLEKQLARLSSSNYVRRIDVVDKTGKVVFSSDPGGQGQRFSRDSPNCTVCHDAHKPPPTTGRTVRFELTPGHTVFRLVQPIVAEAECLECHEKAVKGQNLGILVADLDDERLTGRQIEDARRQSWALAAAFAVLLVSFAVIIRFVVVARLQNVKRLLEFVRAGAGVSGRSPQSFDENDEIERLVHSFAEELEDRQALDRAVSSLAGVLDRHQEPVLLLDPGDRVLGANHSFLSRSSSARALEAGQPVARQDELMQEARENGWALGEDADAPLVAILQDAAGRELAVVEVWAEVAGEQTREAGSGSLLQTDSEWQLYTAVIASAIGSDPKRWRGVLQLDRRLTSGKRLLNDLAVAATELASERTEIDLRAMIHLVLWDIRGQFPGVTWHALLEGNHVTVGARYQLRALLRRLARAAATQAGPGGHAVFFTQLKADGSKVFVGAWASSDGSPLTVDGEGALPISSLIARNHGGEVEIDRGFDIGPVAAALGQTLPCDARGVLFIAELAVDGWRG